MVIHLWIKWIIIYFVFGIIFSLQFGCGLSADINTSDSCDEIIKDPGNIVWQELGARPGGKTIIQVTLVVKSARIQENCVAGVGARH